MRAGLLIKKSIVHSLLFTSRVPSSRVFIRAMGNQISYMNCCNGGKNTVDDSSEDVPVERKDDPGAEKPKDGPKKNAKKKCDSLLHESVGSSKTYEIEKGFKLIISQGDITKWRGGEKSAIVNAANEQMLGGGGVDGAIHRAAGDGLLHACHQVPEVRPGVRCPTGEARATAAGELGCARVVHTVGPRYRNRVASEFLLKQAYKSTLQVAHKERLEKVAFPAISCGAYGYPLDEAADVALAAVRDHRGPDLELAEFVLFGGRGGGRDIWSVWTGKADALFGGRPNQQNTPDRSMANNIDTEDQKLNIKDFQKKKPRRSSGASEGDRGSART